MIDSMRYADGFTSVVTQPAPSAIHARPRRKEGGPPPRIVVVEDTPDIRKLMRFMLERTGAQVLSVGDGQSAADMIDNWPAPDLIVLDRMLPFVSGDDLIRRIRADETWRHVPIVVVSAKARREDIAQSLSEGADDYLTKPFSPTQFMQTVERYV